MLLIERILTLEEMSIPNIMFTYKNENNDECDVGSRELQDFFTHLNLVFQDSLRIQ